MPSKATWDVERARRLYDQGLSCRKIGDAIGVSPSCIVGYAKRHWPPREIDKQTYAAKFRPPNTERHPTPERCGPVTLPPLPSLTYLD